MGQDDDCQWLLLSQKKKITKYVLPSTQHLALLATISLPNKSNLNLNQGLDLQKYREQSNMLNSTTEMQTAKYGLWETLQDQ